MLNKNSQFNKIMSMLYLDLVIMIYAYFNKNIKQLNEFF